MNPRAKPDLRVIPAIRNEAPQIFRHALHELASALAAVPETSNEQTYVSMARALVHCADMGGHSGSRTIRHLERQFVGELFLALPNNAPRLLPAQRKS